MSNKQISSRRAKTSPTPLRPERPRRRGSLARWIVAGLATVILVAAIALFVSQGGRAGALAAERHALGDRQAPVTVLEWADFQ